VIKILWARIRCQIYLLYKLVLFSFKRSDFCFELVLFDENKKIILIAAAKADSYNQTTFLEYVMGKNIEKIFYENHPIIFYRDPLGLPAHEY
jgi:hypothetical protein